MSTDIAELRETACPHCLCLHDLGLPALYITYRNDKGQPRDPSGIYQFGLTEWRDLHAAVEYVLSQPGARNVVLIGHSMGGSIIAKFLYESPLAGSVTGAVIDSPMMDFKAPVDSGARKRHLPGFVTSAGKWMTTLRFGLDWDAMDYLKNADRLDVPILLIHGENDTYVPIETSNKLAELRPDLVTYSVYPNATHTNSWNVRLRALRARAQGVSTQGHKVRLVRIQAFGASHAVRHNPCHGPAI